MANRVLFHLSYSKKILINAEDLPKLLNILEGASVTDYSYVGNEQVHYICSEPYHVEFGHTSDRTYITEEQYDELRKAEHERKEAEGE